MKRNHMACAALVFCGVVGMAGSATADDGRWKLTKPGVVTDSFTDTQWTQRDNLGDVNWHDAKAHCEGLKLDGGGWQLPTMSELSQVYSGAQNDKVSCGAYKGDDVTCRATKLFYLTSWSFWSSETKGSSEAWYFSLGNGNRGSSSVSPTVTRAGVVCEASFLSRGAWRFGPSDIFFSPARSAGFFSFQR